MPQIYNPVSVVRDHVAHYQADRFAPQQEGVDQIYFGGGYANPVLANDLAEIVAGLEGIPVGAIITRIEFYGRSGDNPSIIRYRTYYMVFYDTGFPTPQSIDDSGNLTGTTGDHNYVYVPVGGHVVLVDNPMHIKVQMTGNAAGGNIMFKGMSVYYTY